MGHRLQGECMLGSVLGDMLDSMFDSVLGSMFDGMFEIVAAAHGDQ